MIDGITVLSQQTVNEDYLSMGILVCAMCTFMGLLFLLLAISARNMYLNGPAVLSGIVFAVCILLGILFLCIGITNRNENHVEYKVILDDDVSYNEFISRYEMVDQDGKIYTIKEKN